jgi:hypothetical protein
MTTPITVDFGDRHTARAVRVESDADLPVGLTRLGLHGPAPTIVVVGGAGRMAEADLDRLAVLFERGLAPRAQQLGAFVLDGGTDAGVMRLLGRARSALHAGFPLVGVAASNTVTLPGQAPVRDDTAPLERHHSHFVLVPGSSWGDESSWLCRTATELAGPAPSVTVLVNGGEIAFEDVRHSIEAGRRVVAVAGSGRTAEELVNAARGRPADARAIQLVRSRLVQAVDSVADPQAVSATLLDLLLEDRQRGRAQEAP